MINFMGKSFFISIVLSKWLGFSVTNKKISISSSRTTTSSSSSSSGGGGGGGGGGDGGGGGGGGRATSGGWGPAAAAAGVRRREVCPSKGPQVLDSHSHKSLKRKDWRLEDQLLFFCGLKHG